MAVAARNISSSSDILIKSTSNFETSLKEKLKWNKKQWLQAGENNSRLNKLCNSMNYWKVKLKPALEDTSIVITMFNMEQDVKISFFQIIDAIESLDCNIKVIGMSDFRNPRYICFYFNNMEERDIIKEKFRIYENNYVVYLSWALEVGERSTTLKVHWMPMTINTEVIKKSLDKYVNCIEETRNNINFMSGRNMPSGKVTFKVAIKENVKVEDIPHLLEIAGMEALVTVSGRQPMCLNCSVLGHVSKECKLRYCVTCGVMKLKEHQCVPKSDLTYAQIVKNTGDNIIDPDDWGAAVEINKLGPLMTKNDLSKQIVCLENQILSLQSEDNEHKKARLDKKRKGFCLQRDYSSDLDSSNDSINCEDQQVLDNVVPINDVFQKEIQSEKSMVLLAEACTFPDNYGVNKEKEKNKDPLETASKVKKTNKSNKNKNKVESVNDKPEIRSYGKPNYQNSRRMREEAKYKKSLEDRAFIFDD